MTDTAELKPVAWRYRLSGDDEWHIEDDNDRLEWLHSTHAINSEPLYSADALSSLVRERDAYQIALNKIDAIRNSIIGFQSIGWSEHIYPLVAALGDAGFPGAGYEASRKNVGTLLEQIKAADARATAAEAERDSWRRVSERLEGEKIAAEADAARMREALEPFAKVGEAFSWAIGPDGIDDDLTVIIEPVARREWAQHLSTVNFTNARASLSNTSEGGKDAV